MFYKLSENAREVRITNRTLLIISLLLILTSVAGTTALILYLVLV